MTYKKRIGPFYNLYLKLIKHLEKKYLKKNYLSGKTNSKSAYSHNISVGSYHRDSDYGHPKERLIYGYLLIIQKNFFIMVRIEPNKGDFKAYNVKYGELLIFDSRLHHGTEINKEKILD